MKKLGRIFNYRPFTIIGLLTALHTLAYGLGYLIPTSGFQATVLYGSVHEIMDPVYIGIFLTTLGVYSIYGWLRDSSSHVARSSAIMAFFWLFASMSYFVVGAFGLGIGVGLVWCLLSGYVAFAYKNKEETVMQLANEHFLDILYGKKD